MSNFPERLLQLKEEQGKSWSDISEALGHRNSRYVQRLAEGRHEPSLDTVRRLADYFGVTVADMVREGS